MGHLLKIKCVDSRVNVHILASTRVPFTLTKVQMSNLALTHTKPDNSVRALPTTYTVSLETYPFFEIVSKFEVFEKFEEHFPHIHIYTVYNFF
jgi:hypothetical protein